MSTRQTAEPPHLPSPRRLATATVLALLTASVILLAFVLPAEYGIDPLRTGRALGLTELANATEPTAKPAAISDAAAKPPAAETAKTFINPVLVPSATGGAPTMRDTFIAQPRRFQFDSREITLTPAEGLEIKYNLKKGAGLVYSWTASAALSYEFHGEPDVKPAGKEGTDYFESYELNDKTGGTEGHGTFVAPSTGIHGWFWENKSDKPVTLKLVSSGFFDWIMQNRKNKHTALKPMDLDSLPRHPAIPDQVVN
jgi:hypothetical protein